MSFRDYSNVFQRRSTTDGIPVKYFILTTWEISPSNSYPHWASKRMLLWLRWMHWVSLSSASVATRFCRKACHGKNLYVFSRLSEAPYSSTDALQVKHYWSELEWYKLAEDRRGLKIDTIKRMANDESHLTRILQQFNKVRLISDHALDDPQVLATRVEGTLRQQQVDPLNGSVTSCQLCANLGTHDQIPSSGLPIHLRRK